MLQRTPQTLVCLSAEELGLTERERAGLIEIRDDLASGRIVHSPRLRLMCVDHPQMNWNDLVFNMVSYHAETSCGTAHCIAGFMQARGIYPRDKDIFEYSVNLGNLFNPSFNLISWDSLTPAQAVRAIDHFLAGAGPACWPMALQDIPAA